MCVSIRPCVVQRVWDWRVGKLTPDEGEEEDEGCEGSEEHGEEPVLDG